MEFLISKKCWDQQHSRYKLALSFTVKYRPLKGLRNALNICHHLFNDNTNILPCPCISRVKK